MVGQAAHNVTHVGKRRGFLNIKKCRKLSLADCFEGFVHDIDFFKKDSEHSNISNVHHGHVTHSRMTWAIENGKGKEVRIHI